jgi:hypothetical protein
MRSFLLLLAFLLALAGSAAAQSSRNPRLLTPAELQADVRILRKALEQVHPQLYRYTDNPTFDRAFAALEGDVQQGTAEGKFFRRVSQIAVLAHCGHTWTNPLNQEKGLVERVFDRPHFLPFYFRLQQFPLRL